MVSDAAARLRFVARLLDMACESARANGVHWSVPLESARLLARGGQEWPELVPDSGSADAGDVLALEYRDVAPLLRVSERQVRRLADGGALPTVRIGGRPRVRPGDLAEYVDRLPLRRRQAEEH